MSMPRFVIGYLVGTAVAGVLSVATVVALGVTNIGLAISIGMAFGLTLPWFVAFRFDR